MAIDLFAVGLSLWFCLATIDEPSKSQAPKSNFPGPVSLGETKKPTEVGQSYITNTERLAAQRAQFKVKPLSIKLDVVRNTKAPGTEV